MPAPETDFKAMKDEAVKLYRYPYAEQGRFNAAFLEPSARMNHSDKAAVKQYLTQRLSSCDNVTKNAYFQNKEGIRPHNDRTIHSGLHASLCAVYAEICLDFYKKYQKYFVRAEIRNQIQEFIDNPQKLEELKVLTIMHDSARQHGGMDTDEERNAFYAALLLEKYGYQRDEAIAAATHIAQKGIRTVDLSKNPARQKSLMSILIQSADCLAIMRLCGKEGFNRLFLNIRQDFHYNMKDENIRNQAFAEFEELINLIGEIENNFQNNYYNHSYPLEFQANPTSIFESSQNAVRLRNFQNRLKSRLVNDSIHPPAAVRAVEPEIEEFEPEPEPRPMPPKRQQLAPPPIAPAPPAPPPPLQQRQQLAPPPPIAPPLAPPIAPAPPPISPAPPPPPLAPAPPHSPPPPPLQQRQQLAPPPPPAPPPPIAPPAPPVPPLAPAQRQPGPPNQAPNPLVPPIGAAQLAQRDVKKIADMLQNKNDLTNQDCKEINNIIAQNNYNSNDFKKPDNYCGSGLVAALKIEEPNQGNINYRVKFTIKEIMPRALDSSLVANYQLQIGSYIIFEQNQKPSENDLKQIITNIRNGNLQNCKIYDQNNTQKLPQQANFQPNFISSKQCYNFDDFKQKLQREIANHQIQ